MTPEQQGLLEMAEESIKAAVLLAAENVNRFAVSRAYYAMFYCVEALLLSKGLSFSKHSGVIASFGREFAKTEELPPKYHRFLIEAAEIREDGDYDFSAVIEDGDCTQQISRAEEILQASAKYLHSV